MKTGIELITDERNRQIEEEEWTADHDAQHSDSELACAAMVYCHPDPSVNFILDHWPFNESWYKPSPISYDPANHESIPGRVRELVKAGALITAEIDRLNQLTIKE